MAREVESLSLFLAVMERDVPSLVSLVQSHHTLAASESVSRSQSDSRTAVSVCARELQRVENTLRKELERNHG